ncbi:MAG TPA: rhamnulokinase, partial [Dysgonamonadaceae bacterium]|nr:rhamnulokinase [Dysgonamonadaceae bacterium]
MGNKSASFLAIDLGASSGRAMLGIVESGTLELHEINRFKNPIIDIHGRLYWDLFHLYSQILKSLKIARNQGIELSSIGIDTWGVDFVC